MADIQGALTKKVGPLPLWGWAAAAGGVVSVVYLARRGSAQGANPSASAGTDGAMPFTSPIIVTPQSMPDGVSSANPSTPPPSSTTSPPTPNWQFGFGMPSNRTMWVWHPTDQGLQNAQQAGLNFPRQVYPASSSDPGQVAAPLGGYGWQWAPVPPGFTDQTYAAALNGAGMGGAGGFVNLVPGSGGGKLLRHVSPHAHQQYVATGMGGGVQTGPWAQDPKRGLAMNQGQNVVGGMGGGGHARLQAISQRTQLPMSRLMALNPHAWQRGRAPRGHIHIA